MTRHNRSRAAFTLIELLVVIAIISLIAALLMAGISAVRVRQQVRTTEDIVTKVQVGLDNQVKMITDQTRKDRLNKTQNYQALVAYCLGDEDRAEALLMYCKLRQAFPQAYSELVPFTVGGVTFPVHTAYASTPIISGWPADQQSAALLYILLSKMGAGGNAFELDATNNAQMDFTANGITARVFKDALGTPVGFKRFYEATELNAAPYTNAKAGFLDPFDPQGKLSTVTGTWTLALKNNTAAALGTGTAFDNNNKVITAYAASQDKAYGTADDVFGYRLKKLGQGGAP